jgi:hypothetical protein
MAGALLGRTVYLTTDAAEAWMPVDRWSHVYVSVGNTNYNRELVRRGFARVDGAYSRFTLYNTLLADEALARTQRLGMWAHTHEDFTPRPPGSVGDDAYFINVNTATAGQLNAFFGDLTRGAIGGQFVRYRDAAPINEIREVMFSGLFTRDEFVAWKDYMVVATNINTATEAELRQLRGVTAAGARGILGYRERFGFNSLEDLVEQGLMSARDFAFNAPYMTLYDVDTILAAVPNFIFDVNKASEDELMYMGLSWSQAWLLTWMQGNGYTMKNIGEMQRILSTSMTMATLNAIADNLRVFRAPGWTDTPLVNLNTASRDDLRRVGFTDAQALTILSRQGRMSGGINLPFDVSEFDHRVTLYTNVNQTTIEELMTLSPFMPAQFAAALLDEVEIAPFISMSEVSDFFELYGFDDMYHHIRHFLVLR